MNTIGLVRVTVVAPDRRIDLALPERAPIAELLPGLLRRSGAQLADQGVDAGGWVLRRNDGDPLDPARTLAAHRVMDGEILNLTTAGTDWPELEYDDLVDAIAGESARAKAAWGPRHSRRAGLAFGVMVSLLGIFAVLRAGPPWTPSALWAFGAATVLVTAGVGLARAVGDAGAGAVLAMTALPFAFAGGGLLFAGSRPLTALGAPQLLAGGAVLLLVAMVGLLGVVDQAAVFTAAATIGLCTVIGAWAASPGLLSGFESAGIVAGLGLTFSPLLHPLAIRLARVPLPVLPRDTADLVRDDPQPPRSAVYAAVVRAHGLLTGFVLGLAVVVVPCEILLVRRGGTAPLLLLGLLTAGFLLRARLYPILPQRIAMLAAGGTGLACLALGPLMADRTLLLDVAGPVLLVVGAVATGLGVRNAGRAPNPYLDRYAEILEILVVLAVVPVLSSVLGLYGHVRGLGG